MDFPDFNSPIEEAIQFHTEAISFSLPKSEQISLWITETVKSEKQQLTHINFIFCDDEYLHKINVEYLNHNTLTDVITFPYNAPNAPIEADIYISLPRIKENAQKFEVSFLKELQRVMIHGVLHLCGHGDKTTAEKVKMREKENTYLAILEERKNK